ncbi:DUF6328 family protein [Nocardioides sp. CPCC 206347]|uniref:DUF6328 family protein n=1 Tax=Nocardioides sp. CPCC 206347 TaxID=3406463 RepID=UPI003B42FAF4
MDETTISPKQLTRNWDELLQEIRVIETGVQILTGFLLTIPFTQRFSDLNDFQRDLYLVVLAGSVTTTALVVAPVAFHRALFRRHARPWLVEAANKCAGAGLVMVALTTSGAMFLIFDVVAGDLAGGTAFVLSAAFFCLLWAGTPLLSRHRGDD